MPVELEIPASLPKSVVEPRKIAIVVSRYNDHITNKLLDGAAKTLLAAGLNDNDILIVRVPGAWELVFGVQSILPNRDCRGAVALGAVIRGETSHDQHINRAVTMGLTQLSVDYNKPIGLGLLTVNNLEQAIQRSGGNFGNKGEEAALAVVECLKLVSAINTAFPG